MLADIRIVLWKEWKLLKDQFGGEFRFGFVMAVILFVGLSTFAAYFSGALWITSPVLLMTYPLIAASIALTPVVDSFAGERERHTLETLLASRLSDSAILLGKVLAALAPAVVFGFVLFGLGVLTVNVFHGEGSLLLPPRWLFIGTLLLIVGMAGLVATGGVFVSLRASSVRQATQTFGFVIVAVLLTPFVVVMLLPDALQDGLLAWFRSTDLMTVMLLASAAVWVVDLMFLVAAIHRFRRGRLILD